MCGESVRPDPSSRSKPKANVSSAFSGGNSVQSIVEPPPSRVTFTALATEHRALSRPEPAPPLAGPEADQLATYPVVARLAEAVEADGAKHPRHKAAGVWRSCGAAYETPASAAPFPAHPKVAQRAAPPQP